MAIFPNIEVSYGISKASKPNFRKVQFGDGYSKQITWGANQNPKTWNLSWDNLTNADALTVENFLDDRALDAASFSWIPVDLQKWTASTSYAVGDIVQPLTAQNNGLAFKVTAVSGSSPYTSNSSEPTWPTSGTVTDNELTWTAMSYEWLCSKWNKKMSYPGYCSITATFVEVFEP
jgi:phage-related protein